jgi:hypothetical protein
VAVALLSAMATSVAAAPQGNAARRHSLHVVDHATLHKTSKTG